MSKKIKVIIKNVDEEPRIAEIDNNYEAISSIVGGLVEHIYLSNEVGCWMNEEGKINQLPFNILLQDCKGKTFDALVGNLVLIQENEATVCVDLTEENWEKYLKQLQTNVLRCDYVDLEKCVV